jgi:Domain of unknown function (DUF4375)
MPVIMTFGRSPPVLALAFLVAASCRGQERAATSHLDPRYKVLTRELLAQEPDSSLEWAVMQHIGWVVEGNDEREHEIVTTLSPGFQVVYATWWLEAEVNNGGFNQYFFNSTGEFVKEALTGFTRLGAREHAALTQQAIAVYEGRQPVIDAARRQGTTDAFSKTYEDDPFAPLDERFFNLRTDLGALRVRFIREHLGEFVHP